MTTKMGLVRESFADRRFVGTELVIDHLPYHLIVLHGSFLFIKGERDNNMHHNQERRAFVEEMFRFVFSRLFLTCWLVVGWRSKSKL